MEKLKGTDFNNLISVPFRFNCLTFLFVSLTRGIIHNDRAFLYSMAKLCLFNQIPTYKGSFKYDRF